MITLPMVNILLAEGGFVRYTWNNSNRHLVKPDGSYLTIDGRTYSAIVRRKDLVRTQTGSSDAGNLIIEWRLPE